MATTYELRCSGCGSHEAKRVESDADAPQFNLFQLLVADPLGRVADNCPLCGGVVTPSKTVHGS